ncbi:MAG: glycosyltransferase [Deltaproteobacteria bacterium]
MEKFENEDCKKNKQDKPLVSVIALCYNQRKFLLETLESIKAQLYSNLQIIIVDDFSTDGSVDEIKNWIINQEFNCTLVEHSENKGICRALNGALDRCQGKYVQIIACDDILMPAKIAVQVDILESSDEETAAVYSDAYLIQDDGTLKSGMYVQKQRDFSILPDGYIYEDLLKGNFIPSMAALVKKTVYDVLGGFDENIRYEDYDMWLRISKNFKVIKDSRVFTKYRVHSNNFDRKYSHYFEDNYFIYLKHLNNPLMLKMAQDTVRNFYLNKNRTSKIYKDAQLKGFNVFEGTIEKYFLLFNLPPLALRLFNRLMKLFSIRA